MAQATGKDRDADLEQAMAAWRERLTVMAARIVGDMDEGEDVVQAAFAQAWRKRGDFRGGGRWSTWLYAVVHNVALNHRRKNARMVHDSLDTPPIGLHDDTAVYHDPELINDECAPEQTLNNQVARAEIVELLSTVPAVNRGPVILRVIYGFSYRQIAVVLGVPVNTVKTRLWRGREVVRGALGEGGKS